MRGNMYAEHCLLRHSECVEYYREANEVWFGSAFSLCQSDTACHLYPFFLRSVPGTAIVARLDPFEDGRHFVSKNRVSNADKFVCGSLRPKLFGRRDEYRDERGVEGPPERDPLASGRDTGV